MGILRQVLAKHPPQSRLKFHHIVRVLRALKSAAQARRTTIRSVTTIMTYRVSRAVVVSLSCRYVHYRGKCRHCTGNQHYSAWCHYWLFPSVAGYFTGIMAGNPHHSAGSIERPLQCGDTNPHLDLRTKTSAPKQYCIYQGFSRVSSFLAGRVGSGRVW